MAEKPNRCRWRSRLAYDLTSNKITSDNLDDQMLAPLVPVPGDALLLHLVLEHDRLHPAADQHRAHRSTSSGSRSRVRHLRGDGQHLDPAGPDPGRLVSYHIEGIRAKGLFGYLKSWLPAGIEDMNSIGKA